MAGRKKVPGAEVRSQPMSVRWTPSEHQRLKSEQERRGITHLVDVPRILSLEHLELQERFAEKAELLEKARQAFGVNTVEEAIGMLALAQLERISSAL